MRPNQLRGSSSVGGFRASSQPPPHHAPGVFISESPKWYRNPPGWSGAMVTGSAGSLDKVSLNYLKNANLIIIIRLLVEANYILWSI